jgi:glucose-6-phosphate isomerase
MSKLSLSVPFNLISGKVPEQIKTPNVRKLSDLKGIFSDDEAFRRLLEKNDPIVYEFYDMGLPEKESELAFGTSIVYPGTVGDELFMTKGHFHTILDTAEVYYCLQGHGLMMMESSEGEVEYQEMRPGEVVYVPGRYAHRSINLSLSQKLVTFFVFRADAGHNYWSIEETGFRKLVISSDGSFKVVDNSKWKKNKRL